MVIANQLNRIAPITLLLGNNNNKKNRKYLKVTNMKSTKTTTKAEGAKENQKFLTGTSRGSSHLMMIIHSDHQEEKIKEADLLLILVRIVGTLSNKCRVIQETEDFPLTSSRHKRDFNILSKMADQTTVKEDATREEINE